MFSINAYKDIRPTEINCMCAVTPTLVPSHRAECQISLSQDFGIIVPYLQGSTHRRYSQMTLLWMNWHEYHISWHSPPSIPIKYWLVEINSSCAQKTNCRIRKQIARRCWSMTKCACTLSHIFTLFPRGMTCQHNLENYHRCGHQTLGKLF